MKILAIKQEKLIRDCVDTDIEQVQSYMIPWRYISDMELADVILVYNKKWCKIIKHPHHPKNLIPMQDLFVVLTREEL